MEYDGVVYKAVIEFPENRTDLGVALFECEDASKNMYLGLHWSTEHSKLMCQLYCPFWILNNTGKTLRYLADLAVLHEPDRNPILLPFADKNFLTKKKARLQVETSQWSDEFPLDVVGNSGRIVCKSNEGYDFEVTIDIQLCQSGLTKIVTLSPFYLLYNNSKFDLEAKEFSQDEWVKLPAQSCSGLWPKQKEKRKLIMGRYAGTEEESVMFPFTENFESFCRIDNDYLGLQVTCSVGEASSVVHLEPFLPGMVPVLVINHTDMPLEFCQKGAASMKTLGANETCFYTWTDVLSKRILYWKMGTYEQEAVLHKNDLRRFLPDNTHGYCMSMSFLYGRQRVLMLTTDTVMAEMAFEAYEVEQITQSIEITLAGLSLSVVDNGTSQEIIHMAMSSSDVVWERQQKYRFKPLALKNMAVFENAYQQWLVGGRPDGFVAVDKYHVDFDKMVMKTKKNIVQKIRRGFETGFWMQYRTSPHQTQIHMKMSHLQIDNQLPACVFPVVLAVVPPPKSVIADSAPKPFLEFSFLMRQSEHSNVVQVQYLRVLIQEFAVQVDQGLINALLQLTAGSTNVQPYNKELFDKDLAVTKAQLSDRAVSTASTQQKAYYDDLHISPLMIHLSFSQGGASKKGENDSLPIQSEFINVILKSVGVSVTELQDVVFKLAYFERQYVFYNRLQLQAEIQSHYMMQAVKQLYVLVLGLDIIGNPFGLVRDLSTGVEDLFYQPFQGLIQGPEEFAEGVALGVQSLFGHAVGGAAGAVSRITGTVGKGVAALTFDDEYQRKRQEALNRKPQNFSEGMARGAKGLTQGVYDGVTGVFMKPIEGARDGGAGGFAKGLGKGLIGVVTRPVSGVVDFASSSFDAVKTVASTSEAAKPIRPPRLYVLVLGLDIIGNPFGLVRDLSTGVEDLFYQPFQGLIQGPEEFAEGVALGVQSLFGHAVGGAAGAVSRITGTVGKGVAALTFDDEYQRKRQEALNRKPQNFSEGMARGAKGLTQGVYDGVTGVFMKPIEGARDGGAGGFAKGLGKGLIGVVTRPVSGVVDFASSSFDAVKTVASTSEAAKPIRPPRVILSDQIIRPYSPRDAVGSKIFRDTDRGKYADTDHFIVHAPISEKCVFIVTDNRVLLSRKHDVMGVWNADWVMTYAEIKAPERSPKGIRVLLKNPKKGFLGIGSTNGKLVEFVDAKVADNIHTKMTAAYEKAC
uniref:VPS13_C domain-containing protein n=1 Tax=Steinernema glaseri TaxID=37863 RepID=A0A1I8A753_9BILA